MIPALPVVFAWPSAYAQALPSDVSITTAGVQLIDSASVDVANEAPGMDIRFMLGERLRWTIGNGDGISTIKVRALADARFTIDPAPGFKADGQVFETNNVRQLGVELTHAKFTLDIGRHPVFRGGPRLVDGIQALYRPTKKLDLGLWGGLAPDFFETDLQLRPGFGPIVAWTGSRLQASVVGDVVFGGGALDRAAVLGMFRLSGYRLIEAFGRVDMELASLTGGPRLSDLQLSAILSPSQSFRLDVLYNAFSSYQYINTAEVDPEAQRFQARLGDLARDLGLVQIRQDPTINHLVGATARYQSVGNGIRTRFELLGRYRHNEDPTNRFIRLTPTAGLLNLANRIDLLATANVLYVDDALQVDGGVNAIFNATDWLAVDASARVLTSPEYAGVGFYADAYVDIVAPGPDLIVLGGVSYISEPQAESADGGPGVFLRVSKYIRPSRKRKAKPMKPPSPPADDAPADDAPADDASTELTTETPATDEALR